MAQSTAINRRFVAYQGMECTSSRMDLATKATGETITGLALARYSFQA
jgi:hypothetical protein